MSNESGLARSKPGVKKMKEFTTWNIIKNGEKYIQVTYLSKFTKEYVLSQVKNDLGINDLSIEVESKF